MSKGFAPIYILISLAIIITAAGAYYIQKTTSVPTKTVQPVVISQLTPAPKPQIDETANWKTYTNKKYKYSINYPQDWYLREFPLGSNGEIEVTSINPFKVTERISAIFITVSSQSPQQESSGNGTPLKVGNYNALKETGGAPPGASDVHLRVVAPLGTGSIIFESSSGYEKILDQILSTFKFLDQNQPEGKFYGGIAANLPQNQCPSGFRCQLDGNYPVLVVNV